MTHIYKKKFNLSRDKQNSDANIILVSDIEKELISD